MFYVDSDSETQKVYKYSDVHIQIQGNVTRHHTIVKAKQNEVTLSNVSYPILCQAQSV